jgi:DNA-binding response OmpR family regulator
MIPPARSTGRWALVIDNDPLLRDELRYALRREHWAAVAVPRTGSGLLLATNVKPHVVFLDIDPPLYQAEAMAMGLRMHFGPNLLIVALSAMTEPEAIPWIGAAGVLKKPLETQKLREQLSRVDARLRGLTDFVA